MFYISFLFYAADCKKGGESKARVSEGLAIKAATATTTTAAGAAVTGTTTANAAAAVRTATTASAAT